MSGCYVYVIAGDVSGALKVGIAGNVEKRLKSIQTGNPSALRVARRFGPWPREYCRAVETYVHAALQEQGAYGEWFFVTEELACEAIVCACRDFDEGIGLDEARVSGDVWRYFYTEYLLSEGKQ